MKLREVYRGIDPFIEGLVRTVIELRSEIAELNSRLRVHELGDGGDIEVDVEKWRGREFLDCFRNHYQESFDEYPPQPHVSERFTCGKITHFIDNHGINKRTYYEYVLYLIYDDPWNEHNPPQVERMWNYKMFDLYLKRVREGTAAKRKVAPVKVSKPDIKLSPEAQRLAEERGLADD